MTQINGRSGAEKTLIQKCPSEIKIFDDIKPLLNNYKNQLDQAKKTFYEKLPEVVYKEKEKLEELKNNRNTIELYWAGKLNNIRKSIDNNRWKIWKYVDLFVKKQFSKPKAIGIANNNIERQKMVIHRLENMPEDVFQIEQTVLINKINHLERIVISPDYSGAYGELQVLNELKKLDDSFYVFCDPTVHLRDYVRYRNVRNLKSAQMDFVVVGPTGIFVLEVKNWSTDHMKHHMGISPHEQVDRAGLVLWVYLKQHSFFYKPRITKLLVSIQHNLRYNPYYKSVLVREHHGLRKFICENSNTLTERRINKVASILRRC